MHFVSSRSAQRGNGHPRLSFRDQLWTLGTAPRLAGASEPRETLAIPLPSPLPVPWRPRSVPHVMETRFHAVMTLVFTSAYSACMYCVASRLRALPLCSETDFASQALPRDSPARLELEKHFPGTVCGIPRRLQTRKT